MSMDTMALRAAVLIAGCLGTVFGEELVVAERGKAENCAVIGCKLPRKVLFYHS